MRKDDPILTCYLLDNPNLGMALARAKKEGFMFQKSIVFTALFLVALSSVANAAETCTQRKNTCVKWEKSRGGLLSTCDSAFRVCMQSGVWDDTSSGPHGLRIEGMTKR